MELNTNKIDTQAELEKTVVPRKIDELKRKIIDKI